MEICAPGGKSERIRFKNFMREISRREMVTLVL